ncbi:MAG: methyltransferase dimerization domain-containing protein, partial [Planctomycetota bacterium]
MTTSDPSSRPQPHAAMGSTPAAVSAATDSVGAVAPVAHPDPAPVLDLLEAFRRSKTMFAAVSLGVFDALEESGAAGQASVSAIELATRLACHADALERLLDACVGLRLLAF